MAARVMVMAGGTGGHVFPALAVAEELRRRGLEVCWLGTPDSFESRVVPKHGFAMEQVSIQGLRGNGLGGWLLAPLRILFACGQAWRALRRRRPALVLGMGGFASGPGGLMAWLIRTPLVIHEQNAVPGMTNRLLALLAQRVLEAFPGSFDAARRARLTGNPVRPDIAALAAPERRMADREEPFRLLVLGGSLGAQALNRTVPAALSGLSEFHRPLVRHQAGRGKDEETRASYLEAGVEAEVIPFLEDMAEAYGWADLVICRAGALTVAELAAAGVGSILVPYPFAVDDHQTRNARYLVEEDAALLLPQEALTPETLAATLKPLLAEPAKARAMAVAARRLALPDATRRVADICQEVLA